MELWLLNIYYTVEQGEGPWDEGLQTETLSEISQESTETPNRSWEKCARAVFKIRDDWFFSFLLTLKSCSRDLGRKKTTPKYFWAVLQRVLAPVAPGLCFGEREIPAQPGRRILSCCPSKPLAQLDAEFLHRAVPWDAPEQSSWSSAAPEPSFCLLDLFCCLFLLDLF